MLNRMSLFSWRRIWVKQGALSCYVGKSTPENKNEWIPVKWFKWFLLPQEGLGEINLSVLSSLSETKHKMFLCSEPVPSSALNHLQIGIAVENRDWLILRVWKSRGRWRSQTCQRTLNWFFLFSFWNGQPCVLNHFLILVNIYWSIRFLPLEGSGNSSTVTFGPVKKIISWQ